MISDGRESRGLRDPSDTRHLARVLQDLIARGHEFPFTECVRLIELAAGAAGNDSLIGHPQVGPDEEPLRFSASTSLAFPAGDVTDVRVIDSEGGDPSGGFEGEGSFPVLECVTTNFGLYGNRGVMPRSLTATIQEWERRCADEGHEDEIPAFKAFLDIVNHRLISLLYRTELRFRFPLRWERGNLERQQLLSYFGSLAGIGTRELRDRMQIDDQVLGRYVGLLAQRGRSAAGLTTILICEFPDLPVSVEQFVPRWVEIPEDSRAELASGIPRLGRAVQLVSSGGDVVLGSRAKTLDLCFAVRVGPLDWGTYRQFLPAIDDEDDSSEFDRLWQIVRFYVGADFDFEIHLGLAAGQAPPRRIAAHGQLRLGYSAIAMGEPDAKLEAPLWECRVTEEFWTMSR